MLRQRQKSIGIVLTMLCSIFLFGMAENSEAIEIVEFRSYNDTHEEYDYGYTDFTFYIRTDLPFDMIYWSVNGQPVGDSDGDGNIKEAYFSFPNLPGSISGSTYNIEAVAQRVLDENNNIDSDTEDYSFTVFKPKTDWTQETRSSVWCYSEISRHYYRPQRHDVRADYYAYARNPLDKDEVGALFADRILILEYFLDVFGLGVSDFARKTYPAEQLPPRGNAGYQRYTLTVSVQRGTAGSRYESDASVTHGISGNAPRDPNFLVSFGIENKIDFIRGE